MSAQNFLESAKKFNFKRKTNKISTFLYFWQNKTKSFSNCYIFFMDISAHNSVQNVIKLNCDRAKYLVGGLVINRPCVAWAVLQTPLSLIG